MINRNTIMRLLIVYKETHVLIDKLEDKIGAVFGSPNISEHQEILDVIEMQLRVECQMPLEDELGVWIFDMWSSALIDFVDDKIRLSEVTDFFINWNR
jgi:hypothetical protein